MSTKVSSVFDDNRNRENETKKIKKPTEVVGTPQRTFVEENQSYVYCDGF